MRMGRKKGNRVGPVIPKNLKANITSKMREGNEDPETFDNAVVPPSPVALTTIGKTTTSKQRKSDVVLTAADDVHGYEADIIRTYSQSSGSISYDSRDSLRISTVSNAKMVKPNTERKVNAVIESVSRTVMPPKTHGLNDMEMSRMIAGKAFPVKSKETVPSPPIYGQYETQLTKELINDMINQYFENAHDGMDLMLRISRRGAYPRVHMELRPTTGLDTKPNLSQPTQLDSNPVFNSSIPNRVFLS